MKALISDDTSKRKVKPIGKYSTLFGSKSKSHKESRVFSKGREEKELGYKPKEKLSVGFNKTAVWYRQDGYL